MTCTHDDITAAQKLIINEIVKTDAIIDRIVGRADYWRNVKKAFIRDYEAQAQKIKGGK